MILGLHSRQTKSSCFRGWSGSRDIPGKSFDVVKTNRTAIVQVNKDRTSFWMIVRRYLFKRRIVDPNHPDPIILKLQFVGLWGNRKGILSECVKSQNANNQKGA